LVQLFSAVRSNLSQIPEHHLYGRVTAIQGMLIEVGGVHRRLMVGDRCLVQRRQGEPLRCEVVGFRDGRALLLPYGSLEGVGLGCKAEVESREPAIRPNAAWLGRVVNALDSNAQAYQRATDILDRLDDLRHGLLSGILSRHQVENLAHLVRLKRESIEDPRLIEILDQIELRAEIELAKYSTLD
jgi:flagellar biosynthesis/type III secretory pathway ATPase